MIPGRDLRVSALTDSLWLSALRSWPRALVIGIAVCLALSCLGPTRGRVDLPNLDTPVEKKLPFSNGEKLSFPVHAESYEYSGANRIQIQVTLLRAGVPVVSMTCLGFEFEGGAGCGSGATELNDACSLKVPPEGSDSIRVSATLADQSNKAKVKGLSVYIRD